MHWKYVHIPRFPWWQVRAFALLTSSKNAIGVILVFFKIKTPNKAMMSTLMGEKDMNGRTRTATLTLSVIASSALILFPRS